MILKSFLNLSSRKYNILHFRGLSQTCLHDLHKSHGAKMVDFAGFEMPVVYANKTISQSHIHTRNHASLFDVSHMLQTIITGMDCLEFIESLVVSDIKELAEDQGTLTLFTNEKGGIMDDLIITKTSQGYLYIVSNAGCRNKDLQHMQEKSKQFKSQGRDVEVKILEDRGLLAIQGPDMVKVLQNHTSLDLSSLYFMSSRIATVCGIPDCRVTRCGYTGEDGVEISVEANKAEHVVSTLLNQSGGVLDLAGLGARDSLRLEAGLCLYGNDIDESTTPIEAGLTWTIGKRRRTEANFPGAEPILRQLKNKPERKRVGLISTGPVARSGTVIQAQEEKVVGGVTSGCPSPQLKKNIAMGYVHQDFTKVGTKLHFSIRNKKVEAEVVKMPFVPTKYYIRKKE